MNVLASAELQTAVFAVLSNDAALTALVGGNVFDAPPTGELPEIYVLFGEDRVIDRSTKTSDAAVHDFRISVYSTRSGFLSAKETAAAVCAALMPNIVTLASANLVDLSFRAARAVRGPVAERRQVDLTFRAYIDAS